jgi:hypothetical protein
LFIRYAIRFPSGESLPWKPRASRIGVSTPPSAGTVKKRGTGDGASVARFDANITVRPSGLHPCAMSGDGCQVSRRGSPPAAGTT